MLRDLLRDPHVEEVDCCIMALSIVTAFLAIEARHGNENARQKLAMAGSDVERVVGFLRAHHLGLIDDQALRRSTRVVQ